jgi:hypothetical protein
MYGFFTSYASKLRKLFYPLHIVQLATYIWAEMYSKIFYYINLTGTGDSLFPLPISTSNFDPASFGLWRIITTQLRRRIKQTNTLIPVKDIIQNFKQNLPVVAFGR